MSSEFSERVYKLVSQVPAGRMTTYREIAQALDTRAYRAVGQALRCNPYAPKVPCHRVVCSDGTLGGFSGGTDHAAVNRKRKLLEAEGVAFDGDLIKDFAN